MQEHTTPRGSITLRSASSYDDELLQVTAEDNDPEAFPRSLVLDKDELRQLVELAHDRYGITPTGLHAAPF